MTRYLRAVFTLGVDDDDFIAVGDAVRGKKSRAMTSRLIVYLSDLSVEDTRGSRNLNRIRREIRDLLNDRLWPGERPLIVDVGLKEWLIQ